MVMKGLKIFKIQKNFQKYVNLKINQTLQLFLLKIILFLKNVDFQKNIIYIIVLEIIILIVIVVKIIFVNQEIVFAKNVCKRI